MADQAVNPMADLLNMSGMAGITGPNPYLQYTGQIPMAGYHGTPTDAMGKPIQSFLDAQTQHNAWDAVHPAAAPGTTLNSAPAQGPSDFDKTMQFMGMGNASQDMQSRGMDPRTLSTMIFGAPMPASMLQPSGPQQQQAAPAAPANPIDMRQAYLDALANPGPVTTPGATVQPAAAATGAAPPSVLASFLASHKPSTGAGGYSTQGLFDSLNKLQAQRSG